MKKINMPIVVVVTLIVVFVIAGCKDFYSSDDMAVRQEIVTEKETASKTTFKPVEKPTERKPDEGEVGMTKSAKTKPVAEIRPVVEEKLTTPAAISIISSPETEKNKNAGGGEHILKKSSLIKQGFKKIVDEKFKLIKRVTFPLTMETSLQKKGYDLREIRTRTIPYYMDLDYENLPEAAFFQKGNNQYYICSESGFISFRGPYFDSMGKAFFFELVIKNESDRNDCLIELGITNNGLLKKGVSIVKKEILPPGSEKTIQWETSAFRY